MRQRVARKGGWRESLHLNLLRLLRLLRWRLLLLLPSCCGVRSRPRGLPAADLCLLVVALQKRKRPLVSQLLKCLSRAYLGRFIVFVSKWLKKRSFPHQLLERRDVRHALCLHRNAVFSASPHTFVSQTFVL